MELITLLIKIFKWIFTGPEPGSTLSKAPRPLTKRATDKANALKVENRILREDATTDHTVRTEEIDDEISKKDESGNPTGLNFDARRGT